MRLGQRGKQHRISSIVLIGAAGGMALFVLPLVGLLVRVRWASLWSVLSSESSVSAVRLSLWCSLMATFISVLFGTPLAWTLARARQRGASVLRACVLLPMILPPVVGGVALLSVFGLRSPLGRFLHDTIGVQLTFSPYGAALAEAFVAMPFYVITVEGALRALDPEFETVAATLGATKMTTWMRVTLPLIGPSVAAGAVLAWARALGEFGATITFAGNIEGRTRTLPLAVYLAMEDDPSVGLALSLVLVAVSVVVLAALRDRWFVRR